MISSPYMKMADKSIRSVLIGSIIIIAYCIKLSGMHKVANPVCIRNFKGNLGFPGSLLKRLALLNRAVIPSLGITFHAGRQL